MRVFSRWCRPVGDGLPGLSRWLARRSRPRGEKFSCFERSFQTQRAMRGERGWWAYLAAARKTRSLEDGKKPGGRGERGWRMDACGPGACWGFPDGFQPQSDGVERAGAPAHPNGSHRRASQRRRWDLNPRPPRRNGACLSLSPSAAGLSHVGAQPWCGLGATHFSRLPRNNPAPLYCYGV